MADEAAAFADRDRDRGRQWDFSMALNAERVRLVSEMAKMIGQEGPPSSSLSVHCSLPVRTTSWIQFANRRLSVGREVQMANRSKASLPLALKLCDYPEQMQPNPVSQLCPPNGLGVRAVLTSICRRTGAP